MFKHKFDSIKIAVLRDVLYGVSFHNLKQSRCSDSEHFFNRFQYYLVRKSERTFWAIKYNNAEKVNKSKKGMSNE